MADADKKYKVYWTSAGSDEKHYLSKEFLSRDSAQRYAYACDKNSKDKRYFVEDTSVIEITQECKIPGTEIVLEQGDKIIVNELLSNSKYEFLERIKIISKNGKKIDLRKITNISLCPEILVDAGDDEYTICIPSIEEFVKRIKAVLPSDAKIDD